MAMKVPTKSGGGPKRGIDGGPQFVIEVTGNHSISTAELLALTDLANRPIVTRGTWQLMALRMQEYYRENGFDFAETRVETFGDDPRRVQIEVREGERVYVREILFRGNHALSDHELLREMRADFRATTIFFARNLFPDHADAVVRLVRVRHVERGERCV